MSRSLLITLLFGLLCGGIVFADWWSALPEGVEPRFVGRQSCLDCHRQQHEQWQGSDHDLAMDLATTDTVRGNFEQVEFEHLGVKTLFEHEGEQFFVTTEGPDGQPHKYPVKYTFGVRPLQQYMVEFPDGRVQVLSVAWDTIAQRWFDLHPQERIQPDDWLHWTQGGSNWNYMCAECHSTNVHKQFDLAKNTYHTTFSEIDVSCEACHGPGSTHVELANSSSLFWDRRYGYGLAKLKGTSVDVQLDACAKCHSHRRVVCGGHQAQKHFHDHFEQQLISTGLYHVDGQILEEVYEHGSYQQSRMYREGVKCTNCHDPHSTRLKLPGNQLCLQCHTLSKGNYDSPAHHHHQVGSAGAACVECHMPVRKYMVVDPRRDHSIRVPRPDLTVKLGVPNACQNCHAKPQETADWAANKIVEWYGPKRRDTPHYGEILAAGRDGKPDALKSLVGLANRTGNRDRAKNVGGIVRASAASLLVNYPRAETRQELENLLKDDEGLVRVSAARVLAAEQSQSEADVARLYDALVPLLDDPLRMVRTETARLLTAIPAQAFSPKAQEKFRRAFAEWREGLQEVIDDAGTHVELALAYENLGDRDQARAEYQTALRLRPNEIQAVQIRMNLAMLEHLAKHDDETERLYRECVDLAKVSLSRLEGEQQAQPDNPTTIAAVAEQRRRLAGVYFNLGLLLSEKPGRQNEAIAALTQSAEIDSRNARTRYNLGMILLQTGRVDEAERALVETCELDPLMVDARLALTELYRQGRRWSAALDSAARLMALAPLYTPLLEQIQREARQPATTGPAPAK